MSILNSIYNRLPTSLQNIAISMYGYIWQKRRFGGVYKYEKQKCKERESFTKILRKLHSQNYPPSLSKLKKKGFSIPLDTWLTKNDWNIIKSMITGNSLVISLIEISYIHYLFEHIGTSDEYISRGSVYQRILILYSLAVWDNNLHNEFKNIE